MAEPPYFSTQTFRFLAELAKNNNREWFTANKTRYEDHVKEPSLRLIRDFAAPLAEISPYFQSTPKSLFRIYRDTRFSSDKRPYKTHAGLHFRHGDSTNVQAPGYYLHLEPGGVFVALGIWHPDPPTLAKIRDQIVASPGAWNAASQGATFHQEFILEGDRLMRPPKGYDPKHPLIEDLKLKDFVGVKRLEESFVTEPGLPTRLAGLWNAGTPFMRFLCDAIGAPFS
jgi:uncharacterized protein (TIGR02453 family)